MRIFLMTLPILALGLTACDTPDQTAVATGAGGALLGAALSSKEDRLTGALVGAAVGVAASTVIGPAQQSGQCYWRNAQGQQYIAPC